MIRDARPADAEAIARVHTRSWQVGYAHAFPAEALAAISVERRAEHWTRWLTNPPVPPVAVVVAEVEDEVCGFVSVGRSAEHGVGELFAIYVDPDHWGAGLGRALISEGERRLKDAGFHEVLLWVLEDNPRTRRFYEAAGWSHDGGAKEDSFLDTVVSVVRYRKRLA